MKSNRSVWLLLVLCAAVPYARGRLALRWRRLIGTPFPRLLLLAALWIWTPLRTQAQLFAISSVTNESVLVGTPISIQLSITNTTGAISDLVWSLNDAPVTDASLNPLTTGPFGPTTFSWTPTQAEIVTFAVSVSQVNTLHQTNSIFTS